MKEPRSLLTPSQFYRNHRPEYFSDSKTNAKVILPKEHLEYEISQISINQKHDSFENLCCRLAEKLITPNLIPQVGPTGGGDGKTDSETYPVSKFISDRWFISDNKWNENESWAFAISAKTEWRSKAKSDVKKIIETHRNYTKIYFFSNQKISSKNKKELQDQLKQDYNIEVIILDAEWIIQKIYSNSIINDVIECLNLSTVYLEEKVIGSNDAIRISKLSEIEDTINNANRFFELDFQLVENCLESAILSRMLELPKAEVIGKFDRAKRFANKLDNLQQKIRIHYQTAWTYLNWYDDYIEFYNEFVEFRVLAKIDPNLNNIELYLNLYNLLKSVCTIEEIKGVIIFNILDDEKEFVELLKKCSVNYNKPSTALLSNFYLSLINISNKIKENIDITEDLISLRECFEKSKNHLDIPFEQLKEIIQIYDKILSDSLEYDNLIDIIAEIESTRVSELSSGKIYLNRGVTKLENNLNSESLIYFGKAVRKLAKEETMSEFYLCLSFLSEAYSKLGLYWAANNCLVSAINIYANEWYRTGKIHSRFFRGVKSILKNEIIIGRLPVLLCWYELFNALNIFFQNEKKTDNNEIPFDNLIDDCLSTRLLNTHFEDFEELSYLPDILNNNKFLVSKESVLYLLGHEDLLEVNEPKSSLNITHIKELFNNLAHQPFLNQIAYKTNLLDKEIALLNAKILGISFNVLIIDDIKLLLLSETILAYLESYLATSFKGIFPKYEKVSLSIKYAIIDEFFEIIPESPNKINVNINQLHALESKEISELTFELSTQVISKCFTFENYEEFFLKLYKDNEISERLSIINEHGSFLTNILTSSPKFFLKNWKYDSTKNYPLLRESNPIEKIKTEKNKNPKQKFENFNHKNMKFQTIIDAKLWDEARWRGFGVFSAPPYMPFCILLFFENQEAGKKIFKNWIEEYKQTDIDNAISITIIKGINKNNPHWYKILISKNINKDGMENEKTISTLSRFHKMEPNNNINLDNIITLFKNHQKYILAPAYFDKDLQARPFTELGILKSDLNIIDAWQIGIQHLESVAITNDDIPIIPDNIQNAPILEVLNDKTNRKF